MLPQIISAKDDVASAEATFQSFLLYFSSAVPLRFDFRLIDMLFPPINVASFIEINRANPCADAAKLQSISNHFYGSVEHLGSSNFCEMGSWQGGKENPPVHLPNLICFCFPSQLESNSWEINPA